MHGTTDLKLKLICLRIFDNHFYRIALSGTQNYCTPSLRFRP